jgi:hypothetical protein
MGVPVAIPTAALILVEESWVEVGLVTAKASWAA